MIRCCQRWRSLPVPAGGTFAWDPASTYVRRPPFFDGLTPQAPPLAGLDGARVLALLGDSVTTDHISPTGPPDSFRNNMPVDMRYNSFLQ